MKRLIAFIILLMAALACQEEEKIVDPVFEFVSLRGAESVNLGEADFSEEGYPLVVQLWAFKPHKEDIEVTFEITTTNAEENVDFILSPSGSFKIPAGQLTDTLWVKTIDNAIGVDFPRKIEIKIESLSDDEIGVGLGPETKANTTVTLSIVDDECSNTTSIYEGNFTNSLSWGYSGHEAGEWDETEVELSATGSLNGSEVTISGDLIYYDGFIPGNINLTFDLIPNSPGATKGKATFGSLDLGMATDGYAYRLLEIGEGSFDVCNMTIKTKFDLQWDDGGTWSHYYYVECILSVIECEKTINVFDAPITNTLSYDYDDTEEWDYTGNDIPTTASLSGNILTIHGDLVYWEGNFPNGQTLDLTLTKYSTSLTRGKVTFETLNLGLGNDGYTYRMNQLGEGSYNVCTGNVKIIFDVQWDDGGSWEHYYYVECDINVE